MEMKCKVCGEPMTGKTTKKFCGSKCRKAAWGTNMKGAHELKEDARKHGVAGTATEHVYVGKAIVKVNAKGNVSDPLLLQWEIEERRMQAITAALDKILPGGKP